MRKTIQIELPKSWEDVTLKKYLELQHDLENHKDDNLAQFHFALYHLCGIDVNMINSLTKESIDKLKEAFNTLVANQESPLQRIITIDGKEYGFEPNLSKIAYGAYVDITQYDTLAIDKNWAKIMSILYRPITNKRGDKYEIEKYKGEVDTEPFLNLGMQINFGAWFFFINLSRDLLNYTLNFTKLDLPPNMKSTLERSGKVIAQSLKLQEEIYKKWMK